MSKLPYALIPSKTFLFGEYAVLAGGEAVVIATPPFFEITDKIEPWHTKSIAHQNLTDQQTLSITAQHAFKGLGRSSAEFITSFLDSEGVGSINDILSKFHAANTALNLRASGADVACQWLGFCTDFNKKRATVWPFHDIDIGVWITKLECKNHDIIKPSTGICLDLVKQSIVCSNAWAAQNLDNLIKAINDFTYCLQDQGLQAKVIADKTAQIKANTPAIMVKGCGGMGLDVILTLSEKACREQFVKRVAENGLELAYIGNSVVPGVESQMQTFRNSMMLRGL